MAVLASRQGPGGAPAAAIRPLPLPSGTALCQAMGGLSMAVRKQPTPSSLSVCSCPAIIAATIAPAPPRTADCAHRDRTGSDISRPTLQHSGSATGLPADRPSTPQRSFPLLSLSPGAVG
ncbi:uncharacterized protein LOC120322638 isoform X2 [Pipra filicauda]|uniref:Uncharacterized protein LOC120322638 isoform X2 n=1 Tax=Pipra filicauda TaxID=649802 RepID=A0A7R5K4F3_9PASS|nr:uncharacterized protein LOC120322638 isoform X2 [Pipra filicauda]